MLKRQQILCKQDLPEVETLKQNVNSMRKTLQFISNSVYSLYNEVSVILPNVSISDWIDN